MDGVGKMIVVAVGIHSQSGAISALIDGQTTPKFVDSDIESFPLPISPPPLAITPSMFFLTTV